MRKHLNRIAATSLSTTIVIMAGIATPSHAQSADSVTQDLSETGLGEIIVTAQKRSERLQDVPVAVTAVSGELLTSRGPADVTDIRTSVPSLTLTNSTGALSTSLRGVGSNGYGPGIENPIALYVDGVYYASTFGTVLTLNSIQQVEVLKGPQGTLFGRNATGGLIQITTREPSQELTGDFRLTYANYDTVTASTYIAGGLSDTLRMDMSLQYTHQGRGWGKNLTNGLDVYRTDQDFTGRSKIIFEPSGSTKFTLIGDYSDRSTSAFAHQLLPGTNAAFGVLNNAPDIGYNVNTDQQPLNTLQTAGASFRWDQSIGNLQFLSLTAYREDDYLALIDYDATPVPFSTVNGTVKSNQLSQEFQLSSPNTGRFRWLIGAFYFNAESSFDPLIVTVAPGVAIPVVNFQRAESIAGFGQASYDILPDTTLTMGIRYTDETRKTYDGTLFGGPVPEKRASFSKVTYRVSLDHHFSPDILGYVSFNTGFKSGGFNVSQPGTDAFRPETIEAYEAGLKTELFDRRVRLNIAGFYYTSRDLQQNLLTGPSITTINSGAAKMYGFDADLVIKASSELQFTGGIALVSSTFTTFTNCPISQPIGGIALVTGSCSGNDLPLSSPFVLNAAVSYRKKVTGGSISFNGDVYYNDGYFFESDNVIKQGAFAQVGASLKYEMDRGLSIGVFGKNLANKRVVGYSATSPTGVHDVVYTAPRTYGVSVGFTF